MQHQKAHYFLIFIFLPFVLFAAKNADFWRLSNGGITWNVQQESRLPHEDNIEMAGRKVAAILYYSIDANKQLTLQRDVIFPQLRTFIRTSDPDWKKYRAYLRHTYTDEVLPVISLGGKHLVPGVVDSVHIDGKLTFYHAPVLGIRVQRTLFPSMQDSYVVEKWQLENTTTKPETLYIGNTVFQQMEKGHKGWYVRRVFSDADSLVLLPPQGHYTFAIYFAAGLDKEPTGCSWQTAEAQRDEFLQTMRENLVLNSPDPTLNTLFYFSKIRAAESIYDSKMGLVHSPGGGNYYVGIWANDQIEYSGPFFPYLGYETGNIAAYNAYMWFLENRPEGPGNIWSSFEMEGDLPCCGKDRGDAAMIAYGTSQFALASGDPQQAITLWPLIQWSLDYCHRNRNAQGAVLSTTDEMEGRISTGDANLATSSLYYGGLKYAAVLANELDDAKTAALYSSRAKDMAQVIENYFGATLNGLQTYRYFAGNTRLRHWICLPLVMGINKRAEGTLKALFDYLWTDNGVLVEYNPDSPKEPVFWDRGTLYALRGAFKAGAADLAMQKLTAFSEKRLLADHVPYVVEAYPENNMRHLSAESALYCRIFTEGLLGIEPAGFKAFNMTPHLPAVWDNFTLKNIKAFAGDFDVAVKRFQNRIKVSVSINNIPISNQIIAPGETVKIHLP